MTDLHQKNLSPGIAAIMGGGLIAACAVIVWLWPSPAAQDAQETPPPAPPVTVVTIEPGSHQAKVHANAIARARYDLTLRSAVSAPVKAIMPNTLPGDRVEAGEVLVELNDTALQAQLAEARNKLASTSLALSLAERESEQAVAAWRRSGETTTPPDLVARHPQLDAARADRDAARAALAEAQRQLDETRIRAPFSGVIVERPISPGAQITSGDTVLRLQHDDVLDIPVQVPASAFSLLDIGIDTVSAELISLPDGRRWPASVRAIGGVMDDATRQVTLYLEREQSDARLRPGSVVEAVIPGRTIEGVYRVPESAFTRDGEIWVVRSDNRLERVSAQSLFLDEGHVVLRLPEAESGPLRVAINPVSSFTHGQRVTPREED